MSLDLDIIDEDNKEFILSSCEEVVLAIYRTGSTVSGKTQPNSDVDYLVIVESNEHYERNYRKTREPIDSNPEIDIVYFTRRDLESPSTMPEGQFSKVAYLAREINRPRILLYGNNIFEEILNREDLNQIAKRLRIGPDTMESMKQARSWE
jgi:predicted nucleotidyltransferase